MFTVYVKFIIFITDYHKFVFYQCFGSKLIIFLILGNCFLWFFVIVFGLQFPNYLIYHWAKNVISIAPWLLFSDTFKTNLNLATPNQAKALVTLCIVCPVS